MTDPYDPALVGLRLAGVVPPGDGVDLLGGVEVRWPPASGKKARRGARQADWVVVPSVGLGPRGEVFMPPGTACDWPDDTPCIALVHRGAPPATLGRPAAGDARRATWALTDRALLRVEEAGLIIVALAAGCSARDVQADANGTLLVSADVDEMVSS